MEKLKAVVVTDNLDLRIKIKNLLNDENIAISAFVDFDKMTNLKIFGYNPDIIILVYNESKGEVFEIAEQVYAQLPGACVVLMAENIEMNLLIRAMQSGIKQVVPFSVSQKELLEAIYKANNFEKQRLIEDSRIKSVRSKVLSFFGGKGGTGKTTVAVNIAVQLSMLGKKTVIIDADLQFGDVAVLLDLEPKDTLFELSQEKGDISIDVIKSMLTLHSSGLGVLAAPKSPELAEYIDEKLMEKIINILRPYYEYIIIDLPPGFCDTTIACIENSDSIYMVASTDIVSLRNVQICMGILETLRHSEKVSLILNKVTDGLISKKDFDNILNLETKLTLNEDSKTALTALNKGVPFVIDNPRSNLAKNLKTFAQSI